MILRQIDLQELVRSEAKKKIPSVEQRKKFLTELMIDASVNQCLEDKEILTARKLACERLDAFIKRNSNTW